MYGAPSSADDQGFLRGQFRGLAPTFLQTFAVLARTLSRRTKGETMRKGTITFFAILMVAAAASASAERRVHKSVPIDLNGSLSIDTHNGSITVNTWHQATVDICARIE